MKGTLYFPIFILTVTAMCIFTGIRFLNSPDYEVQEKGNKDQFIPLLLCIIYAVFLGGRPPINIFGDTVNYMRSYQLMSVDEGFTNIDWHGEWLWQWLMYGCKFVGLSLTGFFTVVDLLYFITGFLAIRKFMPDNVLLGTLFMLGSLMFFSFATNGLRNGLACQITLLGFALIVAGDMAPGVICLAAAFAIHRSVMLPIASFVAGMYVFKDMKLVIAFWVASIFLSLIAGDWFTNFFAGLGFDDRMESYAVRQDEQYRNTTFRWDFLLYSAMPVLMTWAVFIKRQIAENWYRVLCVAYCLSNAFWVLVIRSSYSNRFAYLSWFLYPVIIAYPLIMLPVWEDQDRKTGYILFAYIAFTLVMNIYWGNL